MSMTTAEALVRAAWRLAADHPGRIDIATVADDIMGGEDHNCECRSAITAALEECSRGCRGQRGLDACGLVSLDGDGRDDIYWADTNGYTEWMDPSCAAEDVLAELTEEDTDDAPAIAKVTAPQHNGEAVTTDDLLAAMPLDHPGWTRLLADVVGGA